MQGRAGVLLGTDEPTRKGGVPGPPDPLPPSSTLHFLYCLMVLLKHSCNDSRPREVKGLPQWVSRPEEQGPPVSLIPPHPQGDEPLPGAVLTSQQSAGRGEAEVPARPPGPL